MISFIIPAYNEELVLGRTLRAIEEAARGLEEATEVIVADDSSTDRTAEVARECGARVVSVNCRQIAGARNAGAGEAKGDLLVFVDADTMVNEAAVKATVKALRAGAAGGGCPFRFDGEVPLYGRVMEVVGEQIYRALRLASGCYLFCTREAFEAAGGFDEKLFAAEEAALSRALGKQGRFVILREQVITSGRKMRTHSGREIFGTLLRFMMRGPKAAHGREGLEIWYGERRKDAETEE
jgi:glycosyltransferase involved in cell wall biosynthesis